MFKKQIKIRSFFQVFNRRDAVWCWRARRSRPPGVMSFPPGLLLHHPSPTRTAARLSWPKYESERVIDVKEDDREAALSSSAAHAGQPRYHGPGSGRGLLYLRAGHQAQHRRWVDARFTALEKGLWSRNWFLLPISKRGDPFSQFRPSRSLFTNPTWQASAKRSLKLSQSLEGNSNCWGSVRWERVSSNWGFCDNLINLAFQFPRRRGTPSSKKTRTHSSSTAISILTTSSR